MHPFFVCFVVVYFVVSSLEFELLLASDVALVFGSIEVPSEVEDTHGGKVQNPTLI